MHYKTAEIAVTGVHRLNKDGSNRRVAQLSDVITHRQKQVGANLIVPELFRSVGEYYELSSDPLDFIYITARGVSADIPNNNGDAFPREELWRFTPIKNCHVFQTFVHDPLHINHAAANPKTARGFILDAHYEIHDPKDEHVELIIAADTRKDTDLTRKFETGEANSFSMGCTAEVTQCSVCNHVAHSPGEFCDHIRHYRMQHVAGQLVFEKCYGVDYTELSYVPDPADVKALTKNVLHVPRAAKAATRINQPLISRLGLTSGQREEVLTFFEYNLDKLPEGMVALGNAILNEGE